MISSHDIHVLKQGLSGDPSRIRTAVVPTSLHPLMLVRSGAHLFQRAFFYSEPAGTTFGGLGSVWHGAASGTERFSLLGATLESAGLPSGVRAAMGFSFSDDGPRESQWDSFLAAEACVPLLSIVESVEGERVLRVSVAAGQTSELALSTLASLVEPERPRPPQPGDHTVEAHPSTLAWQQEVEDAVDAISAGVVHKVVLGRSVVVKSEAPIPPFDLVHHLGAVHVGCYVFGWQVGDAVFLGATPELLLAKDGRQVVSNPLAGSARRGSSDQSDQAIGDELMASSKNRSEHAFVVDDVAERLDELTENLTIPTEPSLLRTAAVQHLSTRITGTLCSGVSLHDVIASIYPTPAVGGSPRQQAQVLIDKIEQLDRGWYSGGIGWVDTSGDGSVALGLRCALVRGNEAHVYAGTGIVAGSNAEAELLETRLKLSPLLSLLSAT